MRALFITILILTLFSCEDVINVDLKEAPEALVIDAWINNKNEEQVIKITKTQSYFDNALPQNVTGASVSVTDSKGNIFIFNENQEGEYIWNPIGSIFLIEDFGTTYDLMVQVGSEVFSAKSELKRVPEVDSIKFTFKPEQNMFQPEGFYGEFVATDLEGSGDTYWIKAFKNGKALNNPFDLNIAFDAGFSAGGNIDGVVFIQPIQDAVTPLNDDLDAIVPYVLGDSLYVELHAITNEAFYFLQEVQIQTQRDGGFDEIFAEPLENVSTNIVSQSTTNSPVIGFFNVSAVSSRGRRLTE
jgi:hypothetical protein